MKVQELKTLLADLPDDAEVYVEADHGQSPEKAGWFATTAASELPHYGEEIEWGDDLDVELNTLNVTAVMIGA